ncbi:TetR/AcrR family transcriptional regulator [Natronoglycomyces albus]|uniref:TetR family transcriptional regulator n=1 Tax=Natronoglycomyces albus TaxID=2811108 RepID=A0A895XR36_9ACTN|nr:TetR/AcrR family transcriptional regulator [Natronoglycomyces albus]QSB04048.1 TetR family transcriptional regulator [Natronoglycomyces albus]
MNTIYPCYCRAMGELSFRERKKESTRLAIYKAAWELALRDGFEAITSDQIAERAGVSKRTFHNYFSSKEEAVLYIQQNAAFSLFDFVRERATTHTLWASLRDGIVELMSEMDLTDEEFRRREQLCRESPALAAYHARQYSEQSALLTQVICDITGKDLTRDFSPKIFGAAACAAVQASIDQWLDNEDGPALIELITEAFDSIEFNHPDLQPASVNADDSEAHSSSRTS